MNPRNKDCCYFYRMTEQQKQKLQQLATLNGMNKNDFLDMLVNEAYEKETKKRK